MWLSKIAIINYRSCKCLQLSFHNDQPNIFIGINDCGKSTILLGVGLLFEKNPNFFFQSGDKKKSDISNTCLTKHAFIEFMNENYWPAIPYSEKECVIIGELIIEEGDELDDLSNQLRWVMEYGTESKLALARVFREADRSVETYLLTPDHPDTPQLYTSTQAHLNKLRGELKILPDEISNENQVGRPTNYEIMRAIYNRHDTLIWEWVSYKPDNRNDKEFWPQYRYLDWNISLAELTDFANETLAKAIQAQLDAATEYAIKQAEAAQEIVNRELETFADLVTSDLPHIHKFKANIAFQIKSLVTDLLVEKANADGDVHLDSQGDGIKRQLWFALLKYRALQTVEGIPNNRFIWCFDEPETHLYPRAQREFFDIIKRISQGNVQSILSTHSTIFIDRAYVNQIARIDLREGYTVTARCNTVDDIFTSLQLRNSDFLFYDRFLAVEGPTEVSLIKHLYRLYTGHSVVEDNVQLINLGGKDKRKQNLRILSEILAGFQKESTNSIVTILDSDARWSMTDTELQQVNCHLVGKQDIEDAISPEVWVAIAQSKYGEYIEISEDEILSLLGQISEMEELQANQKFYKRYCNLIRQKLIEVGKDDFAHGGIFPSKGEEWGELISAHIFAHDKIPVTIKKAFNQLTGV